MPEWSWVGIVEPSPHDPGTAYLAAERHRLDDFRPLLWRTRDHGASWERLDAGLPADEFCRVIREDPVRRDLLYCGTEAGIHVSYDGGGTWRSLRGTLPVVPVHDLLVKDDDLVAATHGRSIWILDDLPAVRQHEPAHEQAVAHLYEPRTAVRRASRMSFASGQSQERTYRMVGPTVFATDYRARPGERERDPVPLDAGENRSPGVTVLYLLRDPGEIEVRLTFVDAGGQEVRSFVAGPDDDEDQKPEPGRPREPRPPRRAGLNRFVWDGRHAPPPPIRIDPPKEEGAWAQAQGAVVPPGTYQVRLEVGDAVQTASFEIVKDPRNAASQADLQAQYRHALRVSTRLGELNEAVDTIRELKRQLDRWGGEDEVGSAATALREALTAVERDLVPVDARGSGRLSNPDRLDGKLRVLLQHAVYPGPPTAASLAVADELSSQLDAVLERLRTVLDGDVERFNELVRRAGTPALAPRPGAAAAQSTAAAAHTETRREEA
jgi:hypothetical protein